MFLRQIKKTSWASKEIGRVTVAFHSMLEAPISFWSGRAYIVLPEELVADESKTRMSVAHETQHHRQRDTLWVYLIELAVALNWWNPFSHWIKKEILQLQEFSCDERLLGQSRFSAGEYGHCLYDFASKQVSLNSQPASAVGMV